MTNTASAGARFRAALAAERPLQVVGAINAYSALLAERAGFQALYLSGAGVANASFGLPDLGITSLNDVCEDVRRITSATDAAAARRCGHRLGRRLQHLAHDRATSITVRRRRLPPRRPGAGQALRPPSGQGAGLAPTKWSTASRPPSTAAPTTSSSIMARTDAHAVEGQQAAIDRAAAVRRSRRGHDLRRGADHARRVPPVHRRSCRCRCWPTSPSSARRRCSRVQELARRRRASWCCIRCPHFAQCRRPPRSSTAPLRQEGTQQSVLDQMQTRVELYEVLGYHEYEQKLDELFVRERRRSNSPCAAETQPP